MVIFYIGTIMLMRVLQSVFSKRANLSLPPGTFAYIRFITVSNFLSAGFALLSLVLTDGFLGVNAQMLLIAGISGAFLAINSFCGIKALLGGTIVLNSLFGTAGMLIPCVLGIFVFNEPMSPVQIVCTGVLLVAMRLLIESSGAVFGAVTRKTLFYLIGSFVSNGMVMFCQKLFGYVQPKGNTSMFSLLTFLVPSAALGIFIVIKQTLSKDNMQRAEFPKKLYLYAVILSFAVFVIQQFVTLLTPMLSSIVLFSIVNGGATVIAAVVGAVLYKEKLTVKSVVGIALGLLSLILIKLF